MNILVSDWKICSGKVTLTFQTKNDREKNCPPTKKWIWSGKELIWYIVHITQSITWVNFYLFFVLGRIFSLFNHSYSFHLPNAHLPSRYIHFVIVWMWNLRYSITIELKSSFVKDCKIHSRWDFVCEGFLAVCKCTPWFGQIYLSFWNEDATHEKYVSNACWCRK